MIKINLLSISPKSSVGSSSHLLAISHVRVGAATPEPKGTHSLFLDIIGPDAEILLKLGQVCSL